VRSQSPSDQIYFDCTRIDPEDDGQSDDEEEMSVNTESGADTTDHDMMVETLPGNQSNSQQQSQPTLTQESMPASRSRVSSLAAARGLGIRVASSDGSRHGQVPGLPASPRPPARSPRSSPNPQEAAIAGAPAPSQ
jgi:RalA-binding protein 1